MSIRYKLKFTSICQICLVCLFFTLFFLKGYWYWILILQFFWHTDTYSVILIQMWLHDWWHCNLVFLGDGLDTVEPWLVKSQWYHGKNKPYKVQVECAAISKTRKFCKSNPCFKGRCIEASNQYYCLCQPNWEGQTCNQTSKWSQVWSKSHPQGCRKKKILNSIDI